MPAIGHPAFTRRPASVAALLGGLLLVSPLAPAWAQTNAPSSAAPQSTASAPAKAPVKAPARHMTAAQRAETVDQRITSLHSQLKITPAEETDWNAVAQAMRDNATALQKIVADKASQTNMTAVEALQVYQQFAQAHVDGLKTLTTAFETLYDKMPDSQKKLADQVFQHPKR